jgi:hypothetical protein
MPKLHPRVGVIRRRELGRQRLIDARGLASANEEKRERQDAKAAKAAKVKRQEMNETKHHCLPLLGVLPWRSLAGSRQFRSLWRLDVHLNLQNE